MAKYHLDRLKERYGWTGGNYRGLISEIIEVQTGNVERKIARQSKETWERGISKVGKDSKRFIIPDIDDVLPARAVHLRKAAIQGQLITDTLRDRLTNNLRQAMKEFTPKTGEPNYIKRRGVEAGRINQKLITEFRSQITKTFKSYTKKDPRYNVPTNIKAIAVTEVRSTINGIKREYMNQMAENNPELIFRKRWIHNRSLSKEPRKGHAEKDRVTIPIRQPFHVWIYKKRDGRYIRQYMELMNCPHDPNASAENVIMCNCDIEYLTKIRK